jgi:DNA-binding PadR family transcriptional regulator
MTPGELAAAERIQPQSLTRTLASLSRDQLTTRRPDGDDRRRSRLSITDAGRRALLQDIRQRDSWLALAMAQELTPTERELLRLAAELMGRLAGAEDVTALHSPAPVDPVGARTEAGAGRSEILADPNRGAVRR